MATGEETRTFIMVGGNGADSYSQNSTYQGSLLYAARERISQVISTSLLIDNPDSEILSKSFTIADFGCSTGPNTFVAVQNIVDSVKEKYKKEITGPNPRDIEFLVFFNDHSGNDFNTLFRSLPLTRQYFAVGVPGSFYNQVLPTNSLHIGHCNYTLHLLSKMPKGITDPNSPAWNRDIYCSGLVKEVADAYLGQFMTDMDIFLNVRGNELVSGGLLLLLGTCLPDGVLMSETVMGKLLDCITSCLTDMVNLGKTSQELLDSFNMQFYFAQVNEFKTAIEKNGNFTIETIERIRHANEELPLDAKFLTSFVKATTGVVVAGKFGEEVKNEVMIRLEEKLTERLPEFREAENDMQFFIALRRN